MNETFRKNESNKDEVSVRELERKKKTNKKEKKETRK